MPTLSFDFPFDPGLKEFEPPTAGYSTSLTADFGTPTRFETDCVATLTAPAYLKLRGSATPTELRVDLHGEPDELAELRASHYTWHIKRKDGKLMGLAELQFAFLMPLFQPERERTFSIPRAALDQLLAADKAMSQALIEAMDEAEPMQREVVIRDASIAAGLVDLGLITPCVESGHYALMQIEVH